MDKLEHFLKKNNHRIIHYFTTRTDMLVYVMVLSIYDGVIYMVDVKDGDIPFVDSGNFQKRFYVGEKPVPDFPPTIHDQPVDNLIRDNELMKGALKVLQRKPIDGNIIIVGPSYIMDVGADGGYTIYEMMDFPDSLEQHGVFQKYDLEHFYNHKNTISQNVKVIYSRLHNNFLDNLQHIKTEWENFSKDPSRHLSGIDLLLGQYEERLQQCEELKKLIMNMYQVWKDLSSEYDMLEVQADPVSFDQSLQMNQKKQTLYRKLDKIKLIEKHATSLLMKIHIACTCLMFYIHLLSCELGVIHSRIDQSADLQDRLQKRTLQSSASLILH